MESGDDHSPTLDDRKPTSDCTGDTIRTSQRNAVSSGAGSTVVPVGAGLIDEAPASGSVVPGIGVIPGQLSSNENSNKESAPVKEPWNVVDLSEKGLARIPENILTSSQHVTSLNISENEGIQLVGDIGKFVNITKLAAYKCGIQSLPEEIRRLQELQELDLRGNRLTVLPDWLSDLKQLKTLKINGCPLSALPKTMAKMTTLQELDLSNTRLADLPEWLTELTQLTKLTLRHCDLSARQVSMTNAKMSALREVDLCITSLEVLPKWLTELTQLTKLLLRCCHLSAIPPEMAKMTALRELDLSHNELHDLPDCLTELTRLTKLTLTSCKLSSLPKEMANMTALRELDLSSNELLSVFPDCLTELTQLTKLTLAYCELSSLPDAMKKMTALEYLDARNNPLQEFPKFVTDHPKLQHVDLSGWLEKGNIKKLPDELVDNVVLQTLDVRDNPMVYPPKEICDQGLKAIKAYLKAITGGEQLMWPDTINMLGDPEAGKTSIAQSLQNDCPSPAPADDRTRVLQQLRAKFDDKLVHVNDFGGHEMYHAAHTVFLPTGGLVLLAYDMSKDASSSNHGGKSEGASRLRDSQSDLASALHGVKSEDSFSQMPKGRKAVLKAGKTKVDRWLLTVLAKSKRVRVVIVGTHADIVTKDEKTELEEAMQKHIKELLANAQTEIDYHKMRLGKRDKKSLPLERAQSVLNEADVQVVTFSCIGPQSRESLNTLRSIVTKKLNPNIPMPVSWYHVMKDILESCCDDTTSRPVFLTLEQVNEIRRRYLPQDDDKESLKAVLKYLVSSSQVIWLEKHERLNKCVFHQPRLIIDICKQVLHYDDARPDCVLQEQVAKTLQEQYSKGLIREQDICTVLILRGFVSQGEDLYDCLLTTVIQFMEHFNLIGRVKQGSQDSLYVVPSRLPSEPPRKYQELVDSGIKLKIMIQLTFLGSIIPQGFLETNLASVLNWAYINKIINPLFWKDGVIFTRKDIWLAMARTGEASTLEVQAYTKEKTKSMWPLLLPVLQCVNDNIKHSWLGAPPLFSMICPGCGFLGKQETSNYTACPYENLDDLVTTNADTADPSWYCYICESTIPKALYVPLLSDTLSKTDEDEVTRFLNWCGDAAVKTDASSTNKAQATIAAQLCDGGSTCAAKPIEDRFRAMIPELTKRLTQQNVLEIASLLMSSNFISNAEKEAIQSDRLTATDKADALLSAIFKKGESCILAFQQILETLQEHLKELARSLKGDADVKTDASSTNKAHATNADAQFYHGGSTRTATPLKDRLQDSFYDHVTHLTGPLTGVITDYLFAENHIIQAEMEEITRADKTPTVKARELLATILKKGESCIVAYVQILKMQDTSSKELARSLEAGSRDVMPPTKERTVMVQGFVLATDLLVKRLDKSTIFDGADYLLGRELITDEQHEDVMDEEKRHGRRDAARCFVRVVAECGDSAVNAFLEFLKSESALLPDLADEILKVVPRE